MNAQSRILSRRATSAWAIGPLLFLACGARGEELLPYPTPTLTAASRREFQRALDLYYAFDYEAAISAFERAAQLDPNSSMPQWGIALALGPNLNDPAMEGRMPRARATAQRAAESALDESARERAYARALLQRYTSGSEFNLDALNRAYSRDMKDLFVQYPQDDDAAVLYAESVMLALGIQTGHGHTKAPSTHDALAAVEAVLDRNPRHVGANHYHIHLLESSATPERALPSAHRLETLTPDAGHLLHMPSHIYMRLGDYRAAASSNLRAVAADRAHAAKTGKEPPLAAHSREFLAAAASMTGQSNVAREADDNVFVRLRFQRWEDILQQPMPKHPVSILEWRVARVLALIARDKLREAEVARIEYEAAERALPPNATWWADPMVKFVRMVRNEMDARMAWAAGNKAQAISHWVEAVDVQDQLTRAEAVLPWFHPLRESLGAAFYLTGQLVEAERVFRDDLKLNPKSGRSLFGLWRTLIALGRIAEAESIERQFDDAWRDADVQLEMEDL